MQKIIYELKDGNVVATIYSGDAEPLDPKAVLKDDSKEVQDYLAEQNKMAVEVQKKQDKAQALASIVVTTKSGKTFDGNEAARNNMQQTLTAAQLLGDSAPKSTKWKLADNTLADVTVSEIGEALVLSIQRVGQIVAEA